MNKKYIAPHDMFDGIVKKGDVFKKFKGTNRYSFNNTKSYSLPAEVVENWKEDAPEYIPYTFEDAELFIGKVIKNKKGTAVSMITGLNTKFINIYNSDIGFNYLLDNYTFLDGTPCGKLINGN